LADQWEAIFDPYHRAHDHETPSASVGLGLAVSRHLAEVMGGSLDYLVQDGRSTFRLRLPAVTEE
jgi:K+-sensing histidine kinase KdpD